MDKPITAGDLVKFKHELVVNRNCNHRKIYLVLTIKEEIAGIFAFIEEQNEVTYNGSWDVSRFEVVSRL